jgi:DNA-binding SARP family transcriptional activator
MGTPPIRLLGEMALRAPDGRAPTLKSRRAWALLGYLALSEGRRVPRMELARVIWPDSAPPQARASLRQELAVLRKALREVGLDPLEADKEAVRFTGPPALSDAAELSRLVEEANPEARRAAARLYGGDFLADVTLGSEIFTDWQAAERARLRAEALAVTEAAMRAEEQAGDWPAAAAMAEALLRIDPLEELAHRARMRALAAQGRRDEALTHYARCRALLQRRAGTEPTPETAELAAAIRAAQPGLPDRPAPAEAPPGVATVLVMALPGVVDLDLAFEPEVLGDAQDRFAAFAERLAAAHGGRLLEGPRDRVAALFPADGTGADALNGCLAALMLAAEPVQLEGAPPLQPAGALARGALAEGGSGAAGVPLAVAQRLAARAAPGEVLADRGLRDLLRLDFEVARAPQHGDPSAPRGVPLLVRAPAELPEAPRDTGTPPLDRLWSSYLGAMLQGDPGAAQGLARQVQGLPEGALLGRGMTGAVRLLRGRLAGAAELLAPAADLRPGAGRFGVDPALAARALLGWTWALSGETAAAGEEARRALAAAQASGHRETLLLCRLAGALVQDELGEYRGALAAATAALSEAAGLHAWQALALGLAGRARDRLGHPAGAGQMTEALAACRGLGLGLAVPFLHLWLAEAGLDEGRAAEAAALVDEGLAHAAATGIGVTEPEFLRLQALLVLRCDAGAADQADAGFAAAVASARRLGAGLHELRASVSYAGFLRRAGRTEEAAERLAQGLAAVRAEGPPPADVKAAQALRRRLEVA